MEKDKKKLLIDSLNSLDIIADDSKVNKMLEFMRCVLEYNKKVNLTSITDDSDFILKHIVDSLIMVNRGQISNDINVIDIGTGGGMPGIPIKILYPTINMTLVDSVGKKIKFVDKAATNLNINVETIHDRSENLGKHVNYREKYDIVISRAVANVRILTELCLPLVKVGGVMITSKGPKCEEEIELAQDAIRILGGLEPNVKSITIPHTNLLRNIVTIKKVKKTPLKYPRKAGIPNKKPL